MEENFKILKCTCQSEFQDKEYGKGNRLHNISQKDKHTKKAFCTVCSESSRRNKTTKTVSVAEGKIFGMSYPNEAIKRTSKPF